MGPKIIGHFRKNDKTLFSLIERACPVEVSPPDAPGNYFYRLCREIVGQQLSDKSSRPIFARFEALFPRKRVSPAYALRIPHAKIRKAGLSNAKARYVKNLAEAVVKGELDFGGFKDLENERVVEALTQVKGIGRWTAEMFLMFTLGREDVFSHGDLGLRKAIKKLYKLRKKPSVEKVEKIAEKWRPYRTYACLLLWRSADS